MSIHTTRRTVLQGTLGVMAAAASLTLAPRVFAAKPGNTPKRSVVTMAYIEVNDNSILNVGDYTLDDGSPAFDYALIFASNINYDGKKAYLYFNENVQRVLDNADKTIRVLQAKGIKVLLSVLGNHQGAGFANFPTPQAADTFAKEVSQAVEKYGLDGVDLDDEWAEYGTNGTGPVNDFSFISLLQSLRKYLGKKTLTFYWTGESADHAEYKGVTVGDLVDYAYNPYYGSFNEFDMPGVPKSRQGAAAVDLSTASRPAPIAGLAQQTVDKGYGVFVTYQLQPGDQSELVSAFTTILYGSQAHYRAKPKPTPTPTPTPTSSSQPPSSTPTPTPSVTPTTSVTPSASTPSGSPTGRKPSVLPNTGR